MKVLSLFDGCGMAYQALKNLGIEVERYYASEIDKYAIQICKKNHPDIIHIGDVTKLDGNDFKDIDLIIGGFPCQSFSIAGKRLNFDDSRGQLFFHAKRIIDEIKPKYFILENVASMKKDIQDEISRVLGVEPVMINASLVSAQNRKRLFWTNITDIEQPEDKKIYLKDILQEEVDEKYFVSDKSFKFTGTFISIDSTKRIGSFNSGGQGDRIYSTNGKSVSLSANGGGRGAKTGLYAISETNMISGAIRGRYNKDKKIEQLLEIKNDKKTNSLTTVMKDNIILNLEDFKIRKLTPIECERLQSLPDNYSESVSDTQRYKMIGNGFNVKVIEHILSYIKK